MLRKAAQRPARQGHGSRGFQAQEHPEHPSCGSSIPRGGARGGRDVRRLPIFLAGRVRILCPRTQWSERHLLEGRGSGTAVFET
eukprot:6305154-Amphidinium_carterae.1